LESLYLTYQGRITRMACWNPSTSHTNRGLQECPAAGIPLSHIPIEDYNNGLLDSLYLTYQKRITRMACWIPSTSHTSRGLQEWPAGIPLPHIPIEDYKNGLLEPLYLTYQ
jgi:hypothetical protein